MRFLPNHRLVILLLTIGFFSLPGYVGAQHTVSGFILDAQNVPIPLANVFVRELSTGTSSDPEGRYSLLLQTGDYTLIVSSLGYKTLTIPIVVREKDLVKNFWLESSLTELNEVVVKAKRRDPAYEIIQNAIDHKKEYLTQLQSQRSKVYLKATEVVSSKEKKKRKKKEAAIALDEESEDPFEKEERERKKELSKMNMVESEVILNYKAPGSYKEERIAYRKYGSSRGLFIPRFGEIDFNFYKNLVYLIGVTETPIISPLSTTSILTYKFKLENSFREDGQLVYKIKVTPRKTGNSSCRGYIYINDGLWNINRLELSVYKGALRFFDAFTLHQTYSNVQDSLWLISRQALTYESKQGRYTTFYGHTLIKSSDFEINPVFPKKFFGNEVAVTRFDAYEKDSGYWNTIRPEPLTPKEQAVVRYRDSIKAITESQVYRDSMEAIFNKVTLDEVLYDGLAFRKDRSRYLFMSSLLALVNYQVVGGFRFGPYVSYFKRWKSGKYVNTYSQLNLGVKNSDLQGNTGIRVRYNPHKFADIWFSVGRGFSSINYFDAYLNQLSVSNYILTNEAYLGHSFEVVNGLYIRTNLAFQGRKSLEEYDSRTIINDVIGESKPLEFEDYETFSTHTTITYTPKQQYMTEPTRKINLGSRYPTFSLYHQKGWNGILSSDVNFDYLEFSVSQKITLGIYGRSRYILSTGQFVNTKDLRFIDYKRFRQSDPFLYSNPLYSFQLLDTSLAISSLYFEGHYIHHFNGAIINNIPLLKKTRLMMVVGTGGLVVGASDYRYAEVFAGVERTFRLGVRRRLKIGAYGVVGESNQVRTQPGFKISFDVIDTWKKNWSF